LLKKRETVKETVGLLDDIITKTDKNISWVNNFQDKQKPPNANE